MVAPMSRTQSENARLKAIVDFLDEAVGGARDRLVQAERHGHDCAGAARTLLLELRQELPRLERLVRDTQQR